MNPSIRNQFALGTTQATQVAPHQERRAFGRDRRRLVPRMDQAVWRPPVDRANVVATLLVANRGRPEELLAIKWGRMDASPFSFFRGATPVMAADLAGLPVTGIPVQMCGDAHIVNLGAYAAPDGRLVFDLNDFDETMIGPWEWDLKRLGTSLILAGWEAGDGNSDCKAAVAAFIESYRKAIASFAVMKITDLARWRVHRDLDNHPVHDVLQKAERATIDVTLSKLTVRAAKRSPRFAERPPLLYRISGTRAKVVLSALDSYRETLGADHQQVLAAYRPVDVAFKVVGTGSVGMLDYVVLLTSGREKDFLFLQVKQEGQSCYAKHLGGRAAYSHQGRRVAEGQLRAQTMTDPFLGWTTIGKEEYLVRQLADHKASIDLKELQGAALVQYGLVCGEVLGKAHARAGDAAAIAGYCGDSSKVDKAIARFALAYAEQTERDHSALHKAIKQGRLTVSRQ